MKETSHLCGSVAVEDIQTLMQQETGLYEELLDCLEQERGALLAQQTDDLFSLVATKSKVLQQLLETRQERLDSLARLGIKKESREEGPPWLIDLLNKHQKRLANLNSRVISKNSQNRELVVDSLEVIQQFVEILTGSRQRSRTYERQGVLKQSKTPSRFNYLV